MINSSNIVKEMAEILAERFDIVLDFSTEKDLTANFFGGKYRMPYYRLLYLVKMVEDKYGVRFDCDDYENVDFYCLGGIADIIAGKLKQVV